MRRKLRARFRAVLIARNTAAVVAHMPKLENVTATSRKLGISTTIIGALSRKRFFSSIRAALIVTNPHRLSTTTNLIAATTRCSGTGPSGVLGVCGVTTRRLQDSIMVSLVTRNTVMHYANLRHGGRHPKSTGSTRNFPFPGRLRVFAIGKVFGEEGDATTLSR